MQKHMSDAYIYYQENLKEDFPIYYVYWSQSFRDKRDLHYHNCAELGLCLKGSGIFFIDNQIYPFQRNTISYIEKGHPHIAQSPNDFPSEWIFIFFDPTFWKLTQLPPNSLLTINLECSQLLDMLLQELSETDGHSRACVGHLLFLLSVKLGRLHSIKDETMLFADCSPISSAISYISQHYQEEIHTNTLASLCSFSTGYFNQLFRSITGLSPKGYIDSIRLMAAENYLINTSLPILELAQQSGFHSLSSFNRFFLKRHGISPRQFRKNYEKPDSCKVSGPDKL